MSGNPTETPEAAAARFLHCLFKPSHILVALSGGGDSVGLLVALAEAICSHGHAHRLSAATVDHALRAESAGEVLGVAELCASLGISHQSRRWNGAKPSTGLMAAAREARYELLAEMAEAIDADLVVTAHTLDDQQETLAMRGARAAVGPVQVARGISDAVLFDRRIWVVRPFLKCGRENLRDFLLKRGVRWIDDPSNDDMHYERVRVRTELRGLGHGVLASVDSGAAVRLSGQAADWLDANVRIHDHVLCEIDRKGLIWERGVVAYGLSHLAGVLGGQPYGLGRERLDGIVDFLDRGEPGRRTAGGVVFDLRRRSLYLMRESRNIAPLVLPAGGRGIWDGRFDVVNGSGATARIVVGSGAGLNLRVDIPKGVAQRVRATAPVVSFEGDVRGPDDEKVTITPRLAPFDRFLTRFDRSFAERLALSFGRTSYLTPPL